MAKGYHEKIITAIDVGTTKISVLVARQQGEHLEIIGVGKAPSHGLAKGVVVDITKTIAAIKAAVREASAMAKIPIESATIGISGGHIRSVNSHGIVPIKRGTISSDDIAAVLNAARALPLAEGQQILHILPQYYIIDGKEKVVNPLAMHGIRLEVYAHIIMGDVSSVHNLITCCQEAGVTVTDIVLEQLASAQAVLSSDERMLGVAVLDIGGGTSDFAIYQHGAIRHTKVIPVAGNHFTNDIAIGLKTTIHDAERIKKLYGTILAASTNTMIDVDRLSGGPKQTVPLSTLIQILEPRAHELLTLVHEEIVRHNLSQSMAAGLVLTGGGSLLVGMRELAESIMGAPVRIGEPKVPFLIPESLQSPIYATSYGLLLHTLKKDNGQMGDASDTLIKRVFNRMKAWMIDFF